jgi:hypothetical protein
MAFNEKLGEAVIEVRASTKKLTGDVKKIESQLSKSLIIRERMRSIGKTLTFTLTAAFALIAAMTVKLSSDIEEMESKFRAVFKESADNVEQWAITLAKAINRSRFDLMKYVAEIQDILVPMGFARDRAAEMAKGIVELAEDVASFNNRATPQVLEDFKSAIVGMSRPMLKYGVITNETAVKQELLRQGIEGGTRNASEMQKVLARLNLIIAGTKDAHGDAARTAESFENQMKGLSGAVKEASKAFGDQLKEAIRPYVKTVTDLFNAFAQLSPETQKLIVAIVTLSAVIGPALIALSLLLTPIGLQLLAISALIAGVVLVWKGWKLIWDIVKKTFTIVKLWMVDKFTAVVNKIKGLVNSVTGFFKDMWEKVVGNSFVPDMMKIIEEEFAKLDKVMVEPTEKATSKVKQAFETLQNDLKQMGAGLGATILGGGDIGGFFQGKLINAFGGFLDNAIFNPLFDNLFGGLFGGFFAQGGRPPLGKVSVVGEKGPELFIPDQRGTIMPNGSMNGITVNQNINVMPDVQQAFAGQLIQAMPLIKNAAIQGVAEASQRGGFLGNAIRGK